MSVKSMSHPEIAEKELLNVSDHSYIVRFVFTFAIGCVVAGALTLFMHVLIEASHKDLDETPSANLLDFVRVKRDESSVRKTPKPTKPQMDNTPPAPPTPQANDNASADTSLGIAAPTVGDINVEIGGIGIGSRDGNYLPIVKVAPAYPAKAAMNGTEGDCTVEYTVTTTGATRDVKSVPGLCPPVFARASIAAAKKFKYKPRVVGGEAIEVPNVRNRFEYKLEKRESQQ